jgi:hypothetical protein
VSRDVGRIAAKLYEHLMAPLVIGGALRPERPIGADVALRMGKEADLSSVSHELVSRVQEARLARARMLAPVDRMDDPTPEEWTLAATWNDLLQTSNPALDSLLRRRAGDAILESAAFALAHTASPPNARDALSRHSWFGRLLEVARVDTLVSWWTGARTYRGADPPARIIAWPALRRVRVERSEHGLLDLEPLVVDRSRLSEVVAAFLSRTPLTDLATCARRAPAFRWSEATLSLVATRAGRTLTLRALARSTASNVDAVLERATRELGVREPSTTAAALGLLSERMNARAAGHV